MLLFCCSVLSRLLVSAKSSRIPQNKSSKNRETTHPFTESLQLDQLARGLFCARLVTEFSVQAGISAHTEHCWCQQGPWINLSLHFPETFKQMSEQIIYMTSFIFFHLLRLVCKYSHMTLVCKYAHAGHHKLQQKVYIYCMQTLSTFSGRKLGDNPKKSACGRHIH